MFPQGVRIINIMISIINIKLHLNIHLEVKSDNDVVYRPNIGGGNSSEPVIK